MYQKGTWLEIHELANSLESINVSSIDWREKDRIVASEKAILRLNLEFSRSMEESEIFFSDTF